MKAPQPHPCVQRTCGMASGVAGSGFPPPDTPLSRDLANGELVPLRLGARATGGTGCLVGEAAPDICPTEKKVASSMEVKSVRKKV